MYREVQSTSRASTIALILLAVSTMMFAFGFTTSKAEALTVPSGSWDTPSEPPAYTYFGGATADGNGTMYAVLGISGGLFYKYSTATDTWTQLATMPSAQGTGGALTYDSIHGEVYALHGNGTAFSKYATSTNTWTSKAAFPATVGQGGGVVYPGSGDYIYALRGNVTKDFYRYSISANTWSAMASTSGAFSASSRMMYPGSGDYIYAMRGATDMFRYSISGNSWSTMAPIPATCTYNGTAYTGSGGSFYVICYGGALYSYSTSGNTWTTLASAPGSSIGAEGVLVYPGTGDKLYVLRGAAYYDFLVYSISENQWGPSKPALYSLGQNTQPVWTGGDYIFEQGLFKNWFRYSISGNNWTTMTSSPVNTLNAGHTLAWDGGDTVYVVAGNGRDFMKYSIPTDTWTFLASTTATAGQGATMVHGDGDKFYFLRGGVTKDFYVYAATTNSWTTLASTTATVYGPHPMLYIGGDCIYTIQWNTKNFGCYSISHNTWSMLLASTTAVASYGASLTYPGTGDYLYAVRGGDTRDFWRYSLSGNTWTNLAPVAGLVYFGGTLVPSNNGSLYLSRGTNHGGADNVSYLYRYAL